MSGALDFLTSQNLTRAQAATGIIQAANQTFNNSNVSAAGRAAIAGSLISQVGGILTSFNGTQMRPPEKGFNISGFMSKINSYGGLAGTSKFLVNITPPPCSLAPTGGPTTEIRTPGEQEQRIFGSGSGYDLIFLCPKTTLPGINFNTSQIYHLGHGASERRPVRAIFDTITLNFFVDVSGITMGFFTKWLSNIINFNHEAIGERTASGAFFNEVHYKKNYATTIQIYVFDPAGNNFIECKLIDAFPIAVGDVELNWSNVNDIAVVPITFSYRTWVSNFTPPTEISNSSLRNMSLASILFRVGSTVQAGSNLLRRPTSVMDAFNLVRNGSNIISSFF